MTLSIDKNLAQRVRDGEGTVYITTTPVAARRVDVASRTSPDGMWVTVDDAVHAIQKAAVRLQSLTRLEVAVPAVAKASLDTFMLGLVALEPSQQDAFEAPMVEKIDGDNARIRGAHAVAAVVAAKLGVNRSLPFEEFCAEVDKSPDAELTTRLLSWSGPSCPVLTDTKGTLPPLTAKLPATLPNADSVKAKVMVTAVAPELGQATVRIVAPHETPHPGSLRNHPTDMKLALNPADRRWRDLSAALYIEQPIDVTLAAESATLPSNKRKSKLGLIKMPRSKILDDLHLAAKQLVPPFSGQEDAVREQGKGN